MHQQQGAAAALTRPAAVHWLKASKEVVINLHGMHRKGEEAACERSRWSKARMRKPAANVELAVRCVHWLRNSGLVVSARADGRSTWAAYCQRTQEQDWQRQS